MNFLRLSFILLAMAVVFGAFGAHTLEKYLDVAQLHSWHTAVEYQFYHSLGLLLLCFIPSQYIGNQKRLRLASIFLLAGIVMFCGSIYLLSTRSITGIPTGILGPITPIGGLCFIAGWLLCVFSLKSGKQ